MIPSVGEIWELQEQIFKDSSRSLGPIELSGLDRLIVKYVHSHNLIVDMLTMSGQACNLDLNDLLLYYKRLD